MTKYFHWRRLKHARNDAMYWRRVARQTYNWLGHGLRPGDFWFLDNFNDPIRGHVSLFSFC
jgi:hypothetical protein